jgi:signal transduction histidine kinase
MKAAGRTQKHRIVEELRPVWVDADPIRVEQIVMNLVGNAVKYTPADGTIRVVVEREGEEAVLRIADTGVGLSPSSPRACSTSSCRATAISTARSAASASASRSCGGSRRCTAAR